MIDAGACATVSRLRRWQSRFALLALTALVTAGCGSSSTPKSTPVTSSTPSVSTGSPTTASTPATTTTKKTKTTKKPVRPTKSPPRTSASLLRPLHIPPIGKGGTCPASRVSFTSYAGPKIGSGPVYAAQASPLAVTKSAGSTWYGGRVTWVAAPGYRGPILIRGRQIAGAGAVGFGEGHVPQDELRLLTATKKSRGEPAGAREWPSFTRVPVSGCYAYQVDGNNFSEVIVFPATEGTSKPGFGHSAPGRSAPGHNGHSFAPTRTSPRSQHHTSRQSAGA